MAIDFKIDPKDAFRKMRERECFGCTIDELRSGNSLTNWSDPQSLLMLSASIQSDCQEILAMGFDGDSEGVRQYLNRSKYVLGCAMSLLNRERV